MNFLKWIVALFRGGAPGFAILEIGILAEIERQLDAETAAKLRRRIASINLVQRLDGGREVNAFCIRRGRPHRDESMRLSNENGDKKLAVFSFSGAYNTRFKGSAWIANGQFFSLQFNNVTARSLDDPPIDLKLTLYTL